ncbi:MAG: methyltransferase domain-containing protein [Kiritimatiellales bacterium]|nr:methyltransferase domain-containing protein [Kiritimatiellales bacterium]
MKEMDDNLDHEVRLWQEKLFARSVRRKCKLRHINDLIGTASNLSCLEVSAGDGMISSSLRSLGGSWKTAVSTKAAADSISYSLNETITLIDNCKLPFEDHAFDRLVVVDALKGIGDDSEFIHECHRVLKNDGWVIIHETRRVPVSFVAFLRRIFGLLPVAGGARRNGYKTSELFSILKDGFDVPETIVYSNGLLETAATIGEFIQKKITHDRYWMVGEKIGQHELYRFRKLHQFATATYPLLWIFSKMEFIPGHQMIVKSRRRHWRPRLQPKLIDGRSIAEAAINTKIGTAAPF